MRNFGNIREMIKIGSKSWDQVKKSGLNNIRVDYTNSIKVIEKDTNHSFINLCSCSYLGLDRHPKILKGAIEAIDKNKTLLLPTSRIRIGLNLIEEAEEVLRNLFNCRVRTTLSCSATSSGMLPLLASGYLTEDERPMMIFDKHAHFSMNHMKSACGDETEVITAAHNDINFIENICKKNPGRKIVYVADGAYSMGGYAPVEELEFLQNKYGLYLYFDDSHSLSAYGKHGVGYVRHHLTDFNERTFIVASLGKGFGVAGGVILTAHTSKYNDYINIFAGPQGWSQTVSVPCLGGIIESAKIHMSGELNDLQQKLRANIGYFDSICLTSEYGNQLPIRILELHQPERAIELSQKLFKLGYYTSAVFFPIVAKDRAGLRIMIRADIERSDIDGFISSFHDLIGTNNKQTKNIKESLTNSCNVI